MAYRRENDGDGGGRGERSDREGLLQPAKDFNGVDEGRQRGISHELNIPLRAQLYIV